MAILMVMNWDGATIEQYEKVRKIVNWEGNRPAGGNFHVASATETGLRVVDVWDSAEQFQEFVNTRLMPGVQEAGIPGEPQVEITPVHAIYSPAYQPV